MFLNEPPSSDLLHSQYDEDRVADGYVSNHTRLWGWRPEVWAGFFGTRQTLIAGSSLTPTDVALLNAAAAAARRSSYCALAWGTRLAGQIGAESAARVLDGSDAGIGGRETELANWACRVATDPTSTTKDDVARLRSVGLTDREIFEATGVVAMRLAFTAVNDALGALPDAQLAADAPDPVRAAVSYGRAPDDVSST